MALREEAGSDEEVVRRVREGETALFEVPIRRYNQRVFRVARGILRNEGEAEDVMQQAFVNAYTHLHQFEERARFGTWLTRIAVHEALARLRHRGRLQEVDAMPESDKKTIELLTSKDLSPEDQAMRRELRGILEHAFDAIPEIYRSVFLLREVEALSTTEAPIVSASARTPSRPASTVAPMRLPGRVLRRLSARWRGVLRRERVVRGSRSIRPSLYLGPLMLTQTISRTSASVFLLMSGTRASGAG